MTRLDKIINEAINTTIGADDLFEPFQEYYKKVRKLKKRSSGRKKGKRKDKEKYENEKEKRKNKKKDIRKKKIVGGGTVDYDYDEYKEKNRDVSKADYDQLIDMIDQEKTDIAAVAREVFPDHTEEGAQSQLRKILNRERPMTEPVANKLRDLISKGEIAIKS